MPERTAGSWGGMTRRRKSDDPYANHHVSFNPRWPSVWLQVFKVSLQMLAVCSRRRRDIGGVEHANERPSCPVSPSVCSFRQVIEQRYMPYHLLLLLAQDGLMQDMGDISPGHEEREESIPKVEVTRNLLDIGQNPVQSNLESPKQTETGRDHSPVLPASIKGPAFFRPAPSPSDSPEQATASAFSPHTQATLTPASTINRRYYSRYSAQADRYLNHQLMLPHYPELATPLPARLALQNPPFTQHQSSRIYCPSIYSKGSCSRKETIAMTKAATVVTVSQ